MFYLLAQAEMAMRTQLDRIGYPAVHKQVTQSPNIPPSRKTKFWKMHGTSSVSNVKIVSLLGYLGPETVVLFLGILSTNGKWAILEMRQGGWVNIP